MTGWLDALIQGVLLGGLYALFAAGLESPAMMLAATGSEGMPSAGVTATATRGITAAAVEADDDDDDADDEAGDEE